VSGDWLIERRRSTTLFGVIANAKDPRLAGLRVSAGWVQIGDRLTGNAAEPAISATSGQMCGKRKWPAHLRLHQSKPASFLKRDEPKALSGFDNLRHVLFYDSSSAQISPDLLEAENVAGFEAAFVEKGDYLDFCHHVARVKFFLIESPPKGFTPAGFL
jgi:hypothetical protein